MTKIRVTCLVDGRGYAFIGEADLPNNIHEEQGYRDFINIILPSIIKEKLENEGIPYDIVNDVDYMELTE